MISQPKTREAIFPERDEPDTSFEEEKYNQITGSYQDDEGQSVGSLH